MNEPRKPRSVRLEDVLEERVARAMQVSGTRVWTEFCRGALLERCRRVEADLKRDHPEEYLRTYGEKATGTPRPFPDVAGGKSP